MASIVAATASVSANYHKRKAHLLRAEAIFNRQNSITYLTVTDWCQCGFRKLKALSGTGSHQIPRAWFWMPLFHQIYKTVRCKGFAQSRCPSSPFMTLEAITAKGNRN